MDAILDYYMAEAGTPVALAFVDALDAALRHIAAHPASGSPRYAHEVDLPGLRVWPIRRFPHLVFYVEGGDVDVWRVLHGERDIPAWLGPPSSGEA